MRNRHRWSALIVVLAIIVALLPGATGAADRTGPHPIRNPVILIPGIGGSQLYNQHELVWINTARLIGSHLPIFNLLNMGWLQPLRLAADGSTPYWASSEIHVGDLTRFGITDAYSGLVNSLERYGYVQGKDLRFFPYDWRKDPSVAARQLADLVARTLQETGSDQVILIGHSMGGLVAREYVVSSGGTKVKAMITLATPWLGAPVAYRALEYGWDLGLKIPGTRWSVMAPDEIKQLVQNYPSVYHLSPAKGFFDWYPNGYITRSGQALSYRDSLTQGIGPHNQYLISQVPAHYDRLLNGKDYGVMQFVLAGRGKPTLGGITERRGWLGFRQMSDRFTDGDEVVPLHSADLGHSQDPTRAVQYIGQLSSVAYAEQPHVLFAQSGAVQRQVTNWLDQIHHSQLPVSR